MRKKIIIALLIMLLAGSGAVYAEFGPQLSLLNIEGYEDNSDNNDEDLLNEEFERSDTAKAVHEALTGGQELIPGDEGFGEAVSENARTGGAEFGQSVSEAARNGNGSNDEIGIAEDGTDEENESSSVADAVHEALTGEEDLKPGDEGFGEAVSENARDLGPAFGQSVSEAARSNNGGSNPGNNGNSGNGRGRPGN